MDNLKMPGSAPSFRSELDLFASLPTDISVLSSDYQAYYPITNVKENENPLEFQVSGNGIHFLDLNSSYLYVKARILKQNGSNLATTDSVGPGNLFLSTMFQNCYVALNGTQVADSANFYPYQSWIQKHLSFGESYKKTELTSEIYYKDTIGPDDYNKTTNAGFKARVDLAAPSKPFEMIGSVGCSIFQQRRYIVNNVDVSVILRRSPPEFALSSATTTESGVSGCPFKIKIDEAILYVRKHVLHPQVVQSIQNRFSSGKKAIYPIRRTEIRSVSLPTGSLGTSGDVLFNGQLPEILTIGLVTSSAASGSLNLSPFNFANFKLTQIGITVDNEQAIYRSLNFDFANNQYLQGFNTLFKAVGYQGNGNFLDRSDYPNGNTLVVFDLQPSSGGGRFQLERTGQVKVELKFSEPLTQPLNLIAHGQFQSSVQIDNNRNVYVDTHG